MRSGRKSEAQTKAPIKDRIKGSAINKKGSASSVSRASSIVLSNEIIEALSKKTDDFNQENKKNKVSLNTLKAVFRRGAGAFSTSHRPNMTRNGWAYARVNKFLEKKAGKEVKKAYIQDDDLMEKGGSVGQEITCHNCGWQWNTKDSDESDKYVCHKCGFDNTLFYSNDIIGKGGQLLIDDNGLMDSIYPEIKEAFRHNGLKLEPNYAFTDGANKMYLPYIGMQKTDMSVDRVAITYYNDGYEVLGEILVDVKQVGGISVKLDFPDLQVSETLSIFEKGGKIQNIVEEIVELVAPFQRRIAEERINALLQDGQDVTEWDKKLIFLELPQDLYNAIGNYLLPTDKLIGDITFQESLSGNITISTKLERDGQEYYFGTEMIVAGGYNIQRKHYRYIVHTNLKYQKNNPYTQSIDNDIKKVKDKIKGNKKILSYQKDIENYKKSLLSNIELLNENKKLDDQQIWDVLSKEEPINFKLYNTPYEKFASEKSPLVEGKNKDEYEDIRKEMFYKQPIDRWKKENITHVEYKISRDKGEIKHLEKKIEKEKQYESGGNVDELHDKLKEDLINDSFKSHKDIEQIAEDKAVDLEYAKEQLGKGMETESEHSDDPMVQEIIALQHLDEMIDYYEKLKHIEGKSMADGGIVADSTEKLIELVRNERENKIKDWYKLGYKVVVARNDGYSYEKESERDSEFIDSKNPSQRKVIEIIKNNPNLKKIYFNGTIKVGNKVGEELEIADDFSVVLWENNNTFLKEGFKFEFVQDKGKYINTIVNKNDTMTYKDKDDDDRFVYYKQLDKKYNSISETRSRKDILKEEFDTKEAVVIKSTYEKGGQTASSTEKLINYLKENGELREGADGVAQDGTKYRYDRYTTKGESATNWLVSLFEKAAQESGKRYATQFNYNDKYSLAYDRPKYKGVLNGKIIMTELIEYNKMEKGGQVDPDNKKTKDMITHKAGNAGGLLIGNRHSEGGIKAVNKSTNSPLEMEGGEVVITRNAVSDNEKREFEGEMLTNREILSKINEGGGGVSFEKGGDVDYNINCDDNMADGGIVTLYDDYDKSAGYIIEKENKYWTGKDWSDIKAYAESYKTKKEAEQKLKATKMADGGVLKVSKGENDKYYWKFTFENGKEEKSFDGFNSSADAQRDFQYRSKYFKMAKGGELTDAKKESILKVKGNLINFKELLEPTDDGNKSIIVQNFVKSRKSGAVKIEGRSYDTQWFESTQDLINAVDWSKWEGNKMADGGETKKANVLISHILDEAEGKLAEGRGESYVWDYIYKSVPFDIKGRDKRMEFADRLYDIVAKRVGKPLMKSDKMAKGGEIDNFNVGDFVMVKKDSIREKGAGDYLWTKKDIKGIVAKITDGLYQIHKVDTKDKEIKYPKGYIGLFYKKDLYLPNEMADGGELDWGADLGDGFSIGNDVYITDPHSRFYDKTGYVVGKLGQSLVIRVGSDDMDAVVSKKYVQRLEAPEFAKGGNVNSDLSDKELKDLIERLSKEKTLDKREEYALMKAKYMLDKRGNSSKYDNGGELDVHSELKQFHEQQNTSIVIEEPIVEEVIEEEVVELPTEIMLYKEDLTSSDDFPMIYVGSSIYANNTNGSDEWVVKSFSNDGVNLLHIPSNPLAHKHDDKHISFDELTKLFKNNAISIKFVLNERELNLILMIIKDKLQNTQSFKVGGVVLTDEDGSNDEEIMKSQFGNKKF